MDTLSGTCPVFPDRRSARIVSVRSNVDEACCVAT